MTASEALRRAARMCIERADRLGQDAVRHIGRGRLDLGSVAHNQGRLVMEIAASIEAMAARVEDGEVGLWHAVNDAGDKLAKGDK